MVLHCRTAIEAQTTRVQDLLPRRRIQRAIDHSLNALPAVGQAPPRLGAQPYPAHLPKEISHCSLTLSQRTDHRANGQSLHLREEDPQERATLDLPIIDHPAPYTFPANPRGVPYAKSLLLVPHNRHPHKDPLFMWTRHPPGMQPGSQGVCLV